MLWKYNTVEYSDASDHFEQSNVTYTLLLQQQIAFNNSVWSINNIGANIHAGWRRGKKWKYWKNIEENDGRV